MRYGFLVQIYGKKLRKANPTTTKCIEVLSIFLVKFYIEAIASSYILSR